MPFNDFHWQNLPYIVNASHNYEKTFSDGLESKATPAFFQEHRSSLKEMVNGLLELYPYARTDEVYWRTVNEFSYYRKKQHRQPNFDRFLEKLFPEQDEIISILALLLKDDLRFRWADARPILSRLIRELPISVLTEKLMPYQAFRDFTYGFFLDSIMKKGKLAAEDLKLLLEALNGNFKAQRDTIWVLYGSETMPTLEEDVLDVLISYGFLGLTQPSVYKPYAKKKFNLPDGLPASTYHDSLFFGRPFGVDYIQYYPESLTTDEEKLQHIFDEMYKRLTVEEQTYLEAVIEFSQNEMDKIPEGFERPDSFDLGHMRNCHSFLATMLTLGLLLRGDDFTHREGKRVRGLQARKNGIDLLEVLSELIPGCTVPVFILFFAERQAAEDEGSIAFAITWGFKELHVSVNSFSEEIFAKVFSEPRILAACHRQRLAAEASSSAATNALYGYSFRPNIAMMFHAWKHGNGSSFGNPKKLSPNTVNATLPVLGLNFFQKEEVLAWWQDKHPESSELPESWILEITTSLYPSRPEW